MMLRALGGCCPPRPASFAAAAARSADSARNATPPKPPAQRASISRRVRGAFRNRPQWCMVIGILASGHERELLRVEEGVAEIGPGRLRGFASTFPPGPRRCEEQLLRSLDLLRRGRP